MAIAHGSEAANTYYICLSGLRFHSPTGVLPQERTVGNDITIDIRIGYPFERAMKTDNVADTLNYADVYDIVRIEALRPAGLLERLAGRLAEKLTATYTKITSIDMKITKLNPPMGGDTGGASVEIHLINTKTEG